jgi:hypothetical protein
MRTIRLPCAALALTSGMLTFAAEDPPTPRDDQTLDQYESEIRGYTQGNAREVAVAAVKEKVSSKTTSVTLPDGFAGRVSDAIADFLPFFQGAVNGLSTSEDNKSITARFNPVRGNWGDLGLVATATEPEPFSPLLEAIVEAARTDQEHKLTDDASLFDDITYTATYGYANRPGTWENRKLSRMFGRDTARYRGLIEPILIGALAAADDAALDELELALESIIGELVGKASKKLAQSAPPPSVCETSKDIGDQTFLCIRNLLDSHDTEQLLSSLSKAARIRTTLRDRIVASVVATMLPELVDNQPQLIFTLSASQRDPTVGPDAIVGTVSLELGRHNFNSVLREYRWMHDNCQREGRGSPPKGCPAEVTPYAAYRQILDEAGGAEGIRPEDRFILSLTYRDEHRYRFDYAYDEAVTDPSSGSTTTIPRVASVDLPSSHELTGRLQWGRFLGKPGGPQARVDLSAEYDNVSNDDVRNDRFVARVTYTQPTADNVAFPISVTYANRGEFLGDPDKVLSAHVGISFKHRKE